MRDSLLFLCLSLTVLSACPASAGGAGIEGKVLHGPVAPGPERLGQADEAPLSASFNVYRGDVIAATFRSDAEGTFRLELPPGDYLIVPDANTPVPFATKQITRVTVPEDSFVEVIIRLDTGMR